MGTDNSLIIIAVFFASTALVFSLIGILPSDYNELSGLPDLSSYDYLYGSYFMTKGLVLWLPFVEGIGDVVSDFSGSDNHGSIVGAFWIDDTLSFDDTNDYVRVLDSELYKVQSFSFCAWINSTGNDVEEMIYSHYTFNGTHWGIQIGLANGNLRLFVFDGAGNLKNLDDSGLDLRDSDWHFISCVYDNRVLRLYVDGVSRKNSTWSYDIAFPEYDVGIGCRTFSSLWWDGLIGEIRLYNRVLSDYEIDKLYTLGV